MMTMRLSVASLIVSGVVFGATAVAAQTAATIGVAARVTGAVTGQTGSRKAPLTPGSSVFQNQIVTTAADSEALLNFRDSTHLEVGPSSQVKLDRYVFNPDGGARSAVMSMTTGAFRFVTGISEPRNIRLQTPQATIGIRGTILEIEVAAGTTFIRVVRGAIIVCLRSDEQNCSDLIGEGGTASVSQGGISVSAAQGGLGLLNDDRMTREGNGGPSDGGGQSGGGQSGGGNSGSGGTGSTGGNSDTAGSGNGRP